MQRITLTSIILIVVIALISCTPQTQPIPDSVPTDISQANMPNPASAYCVEQGFKSEIRTAADGSQSGVCIFPDGSECDEWAYFRGECEPASQSTQTSFPTEIPTARPINPDEYQGWWTYTHTEYDFSIMLPEDWTVDEITTSDPLMNGHLLNLYTEGLNIRMTFRHVGEDVLLWPTGVGTGEFISQGTLDVAGLSTQRNYFVCPNGEINSIWYHGNEGSPNIQRGDLEFGFIFSLTNFYCEAGHRLDGKSQHVGEMIIASLKVP